MENILDQNMYMYKALRIIVKYYIIKNQFIIANVNRNKLYF